MLVVSGVLVVMFAPIFSLLVYASVEQRHSERQAFRSQEAIAVGNRLEKLVIDLETGVRGFVASGGRDTFLAPWTAARREYPGQAALLGRLVADDTGGRRLAASIKAAIDDYVSLYSLPMISLARDRPDVARSVIVNGTGRDRVASIRALFGDLFARERAVLQRRADRAEARSRTAVALGIGGLAAAVLAIAVLGLYLGRSVVRPIKRVASGAERVASGDLTARVPDDRQDELGDLGRAFNAMAASLEQSREEIDRRTRELERSNRELAQYAVVTSHDLKEPLQTIAVFAQLLERRSRGRLDATADQYLDAIQAGTEHMRTLVRDLLEYSRVGQGEMLRERVDAEAMVGQVMSNLDAAIAERDAEVTHDPIPDLEGDANRLCQVLQNLVSNALKFTDGRSPRVHVSSQPHGGGLVRVSVRDNGVGIDPEQAQRIFEPFARVGERRDGTGIGLAICQKIVERHGGSIWVESEPGAGSTFSFTVPAADGPDRPSAPAPDLAPAAVARDFLRRNGLAGG
ncbi:MAG: HAMP domain-containing protein [Thermoleophilaceae bacterium]|nr:HAMP domain-containing protein [Thermoleophilaceae bacterium]